MEELIQEECKAAREEALEEGRAEGRKEGLEEGAILFEQVLTRLKNGDSKESIMRDLSVSDELIKRAQALLV
jgi:flagellar biosynthesis/type III secretory pathway protein FliH